MIVFFFIIISLVLYGNLESYNYVIYSTPGLEEPIDCSMILMLWNSVVPLIDYAIQVYHRPTRKTYIIWLLVHILISIYACVGLSILYRSEVIETILANSDHYNYNNNLIVIVTMKVIFWLTILPLIISSIAFVIAVIEKLLNIYEQESPMCKIISEWMKPPKPSVTNIPICTICLNFMKANSDQNKTNEVAQLPCSAKHVFHIGCLRQKL